jgi:hypothetical protein
MIKIYNPSLEKLSSLLKTLISLMILSNNTKKQKLHFKNKKKSQNN